MSTEYRPTCRRSIDQLATEGRPKYRPRVGRRVPYTAISRKVVGKNVHTTIPKGNMGYDQYTVPDTVAVEPTFVSFF